MSSHVHVTLHWINIRKWILEIPGRFPRIDVESVFQFSYFAPTRDPTVEAWPLKCLVIYYPGFNNPPHPTPPSHTPNLSKAQAWELKQLRSHSPSHGSLGLNSPVITVIYTSWYTSEPCLCQPLFAVSQPVLSSMHICTCKRSPVPPVVPPWRALQKLQHITAYCCSCGWQQVHRDNWQISGNKEVMP